MRRALLVVALLAGLLVAPAPSPVHLSYVTSDSMAPTIGAGDGYVVVDAGAVERGDVITFWSTERGEYVTHRVVDRTDAGYVTKGDANPTTDQAAGFPPVQREDVLGEVLSVGGYLVVVPGLGAVVRPLQANPLLAFGAASLVALGALVLLGRRSRRARTRRVVRVDDVILPVLATGLFGGIVLVLLLGGTVHHFTYVAVDGDAAGGTQVVAGVPEERTYEVAVARPPFTRVLVEADGMTVREKTVDGGRITLETELQPPPEPGTFRTSVRTRPYPATLPVDLQRSLHEVHPVVATVASVGAAFVPLGLLYLLLLDGGVPLRPPRNRLLRRLGGER